MAILRSQHGAFIALLLFGILGVEGTPLGTLSTTKKVAENNAPTPTPSESDATTAAASATEANGTTLSGSTHEACQSLRFTDGEINGDYHWDHVSGICTFLAGFGSASSLEDTCKCVCPICANLEAAYPGASGAVLSVKAAESIKAQSPEHNTYWVNATSRNHELSTFGSYNGNEVGEVVREFVKDTDFIAQHKNIKETLVNLSYLEYAETKRTMTLRNPHNQSDAECAMIFLGLQMIIRGSGFVCHDELGLLCTAHLHGGQGS